MEAILATTTALIIFLVLATGAAVYLIWQLSNRRGAAARRREQIAASAARRGDQRIYSKHEEQVLKKAKSLGQRGQAQFGSQLLEQVGLHREAIMLLETHGLIDDAARILIKMQRPNRAGVIYAKHGRWAQAAECFQTAGLDLEAAKCLREAEDFQKAADIFRNLGRNEDAANCLALSKQWQPAALSFLKIGQMDKAAISYGKLFEEQGNSSSADFEGIELDFFSQQILDGHINEGYINALSRCGRLVDVIKAILKLSRIEDAARLFNSSTTDIGLLLLGGVNLQDIEGKNLGEMFLSVAQFKLAGMLFEQIGDFSQAAIAFERSENFDRAAYCYERSGNQSKVSEMKLKRQSVKAGDNPQRSSFSTASDKTDIVDTGQAARSFASNQPKAGQDKAGGIGQFVLEAIEPSPELAVAENVAVREVFFSCGLFAALDSQQKQRIWNISSMVEFAPAQAILDWDMEPLGLYVVTSGKVDCIKRDGAKETTINTLEPASYFAEMWVFAEHPVDVKFIASEQTCIFVVERANFIRLLDEDGGIARKLYKLFTHRLLA